MEIRPRLFKLDSLMHERCFRAPGYQTIAAVWNVAIVTFRLMNAHTFALIAVTVLAQTSRAEPWRDQQPPLSAHQAQATFADSVYLTDPNYHRMMWVWQAEERARDAAKQRGLQGSERDRFIEKKVKDAKEQVLPKGIGDTPASAIDLDAAAFLPFPNLQKYYLGTVNEQLRNPYTPIYNANRPDKTGVRIFEIALDPKHPDHDRAVRALQEYVKWEPNLPFDQQAPIAKGKKDFILLGRTEEIEQRIDKLLKGVSLSRNERKRVGEAVTKGIERAFKNQEERAVAMKKAMEARKEEVQKHGREASVWQTLTNDEKAALYNEGFHSNQLMMGTMGGIVRLFGDAELGNRMNGAIAINSALNAVITTSLTKSFANNPALYANVYVGLAVALSEMMSANQKKSEMEGVMAALQQIAQQIQELRKEMHERFDKLDAKIDSYFEKSFFVLQNIANNQIKGDLSSLRQALIDLNIEVQNGFRTAWAAYESAMISECLFVPTKFPDVVRRCRLYYASLANNVAPPADVSRGDLQALTASDWQQFKERIAVIDDSEITSLRYHPATWLYAANSLLDFYQLNRKWVATASEPTPSQPDWSLDGVIQAGRMILQSLDSLVLDKGRLKQDLLLQLLEQYRFEAEAAFDTGLDIARAFSHQGPNPFLGGKQPPIEHRYNFINEPIGFCPDSAKAIQLTRQRGVGGWDNNFGEFVRTQIKTTPLIYNMLPNEVMWASIMGEKQDQRDESQFALVKVSTCWKEINYLKYVETRSTVNLHVRMVLEARLDYRKPGEAEIKDVVISRATYDQEHTFPRHDNYPFRDQNRGSCRLYVRLWAGEGLCTSGAYFQKQWEAGEKILNDKKNIEFVQDPKITAFKKYFDDFGKKNQARALEQFRANYKGPESVTARRTLFLALYMGLDPLAAEDLLSLLSSDSGMPNYRTLQELGLRGSIRRADFSKLLEQRLAIARAKIESLATVPSLAPRTEEIEAVLTRLERLKSSSGNPRSVPRRTQQLSLNQCVRSC
jgi:hypothetical protein